MNTAIAPTAAAPHVLNASSHPQPMPFYEALAERPGLQLDEERKVWIAAHPDTVQAVLASPLLKVRPAAEPVPKGLVGGPAGELFGRWLRMTDGPFHAAGKPAMSAALQSWTEACADEIVATSQATSARQLETGWDAWMWTTPASTVAQLLGIPWQQEGAVLAALRALGQGFAPGADAAQCAAAHQGALTLLALVDESEARGGNRLIEAMRAEALARGWADAQAVRANLVAPLWQVFEATAALLGHGLLALAQDPAQAEHLRAPGADWMGFLQALFHTRLPIHHTRRFAHDAVDIAGTLLPAGAAIVVVLTNVAPKGCPVHAGAGVSFGKGPHVCPGQEWALLIAQGALQEALRTPLPWPAMDQPQYRGTANLRLPIFTNTPPAKAAA